MPESGITPEFEIDEPPPPIEKDHIRSSGSSSRPPLPPKEMSKRKSQGSMLQVVSNNPDLLSPNGFVPKRRRKYQPPFLNHLTSLRNWIKETSKRARSPGSKASSGKSPTITQSKSPDSRRRANPANRNSGVHAHHANVAPSTHVPARPRVSTHGSGKRPSISPAPTTPRGSYRRSSGGLRGRKSTSSSVSSIRSMPHHHHSHSKASSTSSASLVSPAVSVSGHKTKSPHTSVKVLPATPTHSSFPNNVRVVRAPISEGGAAFGTAPPPSPGLVFAKRKRSPFKGPMLNLNTHTGSPAPRSRMDAAATNRSTSVQGRPSGDFMGITEEEEEDEVEEVEEFSPVMASMGEVVEETTAGAQTPLANTPGETEGRVELGGAKESVGG
jgi:hypothetical protein